MRVKIYQINPERDSNRMKFMSLSDSQSPDPAIYDEVFDAEIDENELEHIKQVLDVKKESSKVLEFEESMRKFIGAKYAIATATSTALTIYNNYGKIKEIVNGMAKKAG